MLLCALHSHGERLFVEVANSLVSLQGLEIGWVIALRCVVVVHDFHEQVTLHEHAAVI